MKIEEQLLAELKEVQHKCILYDGNEKMLFAIARIEELIDLIEAQI